MKFIKVMKPIFSPVANVFNYLMFNVDLKFTIYHLLPSVLPIYLQHTNLTPADSNHSIKRLFSLRASVQFLVSQRYG